MPFKVSNTPAILVRKQHLYVFDEGATRLQFLNRASHGEKNFVALVAGIARASSRKSLARRAGKNHQRTLFAVTSLAVSTTHRETGGLLVDLFAGPVCERLRFGVAIVSGPMQPLAETRLVGLCLSGRRGSFVVFGHTGPYP